MNLKVCFGHHVDCVELQIYWTSAELLLPDRSAAVSAIVEIRDMCVCILTISRKVISVLNIHLVVMQTLTTIDD